MRRHIKKDIIAVTTSDRFEKHKLLNGKFPYSVHDKSSELFKRELEISDNNKVFKENGELALELQDYGCLFIVIEENDKYFVYGDSPLHYVDDALEFHKTPVKFEEFEKITGRKIKL